MVSDASLVLIPLLAVLAPLLARGLGRWLPIPIVVFELALGILVGPDVLGWAQTSEFLEILSELGLAMLFFVAGSEIDARSLRGRTGRRAIGGWIMSLALGLAAGWLIFPGEAAIIIGVALSSTALGTLLPILRDAGELRTPFGKSVGAVGAVGEFGPLIAISVFLGSRDPGASTIVLTVFVVIAALAAWYASRTPQGALHRFVSASLHTSGQFGVRVVLLILAALATLSIALDLDMLLGAFAAGIIWRIMMRDASKDDQEAVESKIEALAFGFLVPIFFIYTGVTFNLQALLDAPELFAFVPIVAIILLIVRGLPSALAAPVGASGRDRTAVVLMGATGLPIIVAVTAIGVDAEILSPAVASVLVGAGMLSVLVYPLVAMAVRHTQVDADAVAFDERM
ncbi:Kef-type K+ transport system membrane component KefB [Microbacterium endophyticum]|uniref:Kef-type K+ transport system membrane component KefB n=1 Tax=Microbacterium endophyticum TaxID=1526412 RepID=A0A7W4V2F5_9MICO|nr:cation:proton antiporter [Microbacterium endophyticum]MBB2975319.1 Kef-type K+ transport system membrane component KefB [Microbacterium endophyticum]NIK35662.1 Kef-type K+ transport system membrane component KefB [Microbacterium endophyticum]